MITNQEILKTAMAQSAEDIGCRADDFLKNENVSVPYRPGKNVKSFMQAPITCQLISYGNNIVAGSTDEVADIVTAYLGRYQHYHCFETPNLHWLNERLEEKGHQVCFMSEYYLPDVNRMPELKCAYETRVLEPADFRELYLPEWSNALCAERSQLDMLCVGAYDDGKLIGLAGCSADCPEMWQIGIDVLPAYRQHGIGSALTSRLAQETLKRGKVPFYSSAWSNIRSVRNGIRCGFIPAWVEMNAKPRAFVDHLNQTAEEGRNE